MFNFIKRKKNKRGFTLVEVLTVMFIIAVLAAVALPSYKHAMEKTRATQGIATLETIAKAQNTYNALRGNYSPTFNSLPLDLRDKDLRTVVGTEFQDEYFDFALYNSNAIAVAARNNGEYELTVDYTTGKIYCSPENHPVCVRFGLEERVISVPTDEEILQELLKNETQYTSSNGDGSYCFATIGRCFDKEGKECQMNKTGDGCSTGEGDVRDESLNGLICYKEQGKCYAYEDGIPYDTCKINDKGDGCAENGLVCDKEKGFCYTYQDGEVVRECVINEAGTGCLDGFICDEDNCYTYEAGKIIDSCPVNKEGTGCKEKEEWKCDGSKCWVEGTDKWCYDNGKGECIKGEGEEIICHPNGLCEIYQDGVSTTTCVADKDGKTCTKESGWLCREDGKCIEYKEGFPTGEECEANAEGTGCKEEIKDGWVCDKGGKCVEYKEGKPTGQECEANAEGTGCKEDIGEIKDGWVCQEWKCTEYKEGKPTGNWCYDNGNSECIKGEGEEVYCDKATGQCAVFVNGNNVKMCKANNDYTGCAEEDSPTQTGFVCDAAGCTYYDEYGKAQGSCGVLNGKPKADCYENFGLSGTFCDDGSRCYTYENGKNTSFCDMKEKKCFDTTTGKECTPNDTFTGCSKDSGSSPTQTGLVCDDAGCVYYDENGKEVGSCGVLSNGKPKPECYETLKLTGEVCDDFKTCFTYENGQKVFHCDIKGKICYNDITGKECTPNDTFTGCKEESGNNYSYNCGTGESAMCTIYDENGKEQGTCYSNGKGGCIEGKGEEVVCYDTGACVIFKDGKKEDSCMANASGNGCIKGEGTELGYCNEKGICPVYVDGKGTYTCKKGSPDAGGCDRNGLICDGAECSDFKYGQQTSSCYNNGKGGCIEGKGEELVCITGKCNLYVDGKWKDSCEANAEGTGCKDESSGGIKDGIVCDKGVCTEYKDGKPTGIEYIVNEEKGVCEGYENGKFTGKTYKIDDAGVCII